MRRESKRDRQRKKRETIERNRAAEKREKERDLREQEFSGRNHETEKGNGKGKRKRRKGAWEAQKEVLQLISRRRIFIQQMRMNGTELAVSLETWEEEREAEKAAGNLTYFNFLS